MGHTHLLIGGASWLTLQAVLTANGQPEVTAGIALGGYMLASYSALLPDLDSKGSLASKFFGWPSEGLSFVVRKIGGGHRKITHSGLGLVLVLAALFAAMSAFHMPRWCAVALAIGWLSHLVADMLTREGCPLLWPLSAHNFGLHLVTTGLAKKNGHRTSEWWIISPLAVLATVIAPLCLLAGK